MTKSESGWIYILKRTREKALKIGKTSRMPEERAEELSNVTGVSTPYVVIYAREVINMDECEKEVHKKLSQNRFRKEFFDVDVKTAISVVDEVCESNLKNKNELNQELKIEFKSPQEIYQKSDISPSDYNTKILDKIIKSRNDENS